MTPTSARLPWLATLLISCAWPALAFAQRGQEAGLVGTVRDPSGATLKDVRVTVSSPRMMGGSQSTSTDAEGTYRFTFLPPGGYDIDAELDGFATARRTSVGLRPGLSFTVDFVMTLAGVHEMVLVRAPTPTVDVTASSAPVVIDRALIDNVPLPRVPATGIGTVADLVSLAPGVVQGVAIGGTFLSNPLTIDGANGNNPGIGTPTVFPNPSWIEATQIISVGADAQYGEYTGALVNAITRSGSNRFSGLADFWTTRPGWTADNRGSLPPTLQNNFRPVEIADRWDFDAQLGGPLVKDRLWFFAGGEAYRDAFWPTSFAVGSILANDPKYDASEHKFIVKLTGAPSGTVHAEGFVAHDVATATGANAGPLLTPAALAVSEQPETIWNAKVTWTLNPRTFLELHYGGHDFSSYNGPPDAQRAGPPAHYDQFTGVTSANVNGLYSHHDRPMTVGADMTHFLTGQTGDHNIRAGFEFEHASLFAFSGYAGGRLFYDYDGQPSEVELWDGATNRPTQTRHTFYAQDSWKIGDRLTVNGGARFSAYRGSVPDHPDAFAAHAISPRIGAAFDLTGDHRTVLRGHYGRYHDAFVTSFYDFLDPLSQTPDIMAAVVGPNQFQEEFRYGTGAQAAIDPNLRFPYDDEFLAGVEREFPWGISARAQYINRSFSDSVAFTDPGLAWIPTQKIDPGVDGKRGTADDGGPVTVYYVQDPNTSAPLLTNPPAYRHYHGVQLMVTKRYSNNMEYQVSYTWSRTIGNYNNAYAANAANNDLGFGGTFSNPNLRINTDGRTPQDFTHDFKLLGTYHLSHWGGLNTSGVYRFQSGRTWARSVTSFGAATQAGRVYVEPRGTRELDAVNTLDLRIEKTWKPSQKVGTLGLFVDLFNAWNQGVALRITNISGPNFGVPVQWLDPRTVRIGGRILF
jgi:hypothetical protein